MSDKQKYRLTFRCECGNEFKKITTNPDLEKADCPKCKKVESERRLKIGDGAVSDNDLVESPPILAVEKYDCDECHKFTRFYKEKEGDKLGHCQHCGSQNVKYIGSAVSGIVSQSSQNMIKALDVTAKMTMETYKMGDLNLNSNMKPGDSCAPKLPPRQQQAADAFFNGGGLPNANRIGQNAIAGAYRDPNNPVANLHRSKAAPKFNLTEAPKTNVKTGAKISAYDKMLSRPN